MNTDDLHWLCPWGGVPLFEWESMFNSTNYFGLCNDPCIIDQVDYWMMKESVHMRVNFERQRQALPPLAEEDMFWLHKFVCEQRWLRQRLDARRSVLLSSAHRSVSLSQDYL